MQMFKQEEMFKQEDSSSRQRNDGYFSHQVKCEMVFVLTLENASS